MSVKSALRIKLNGQWVAVPVMIGDAEVDGVVRYDEAQTLTEEEKALARENIGAGAGGEVDISGVVRYDEAQTLTEEEKNIARENIGMIVPYVQRDTVSAASWEGDGPPYTSTRTIWGMTGKHTIIVTPASDISKEEYEEIAAAKIICAEQGAGYVTLKAFGVKPKYQFDIFVTTLGVTE